MLFFDSEVWERKESVEYWIVQNSKNFVKAYMKKAPNKKLGAFRFIKKSKLD